MLSVIPPIDMKEIESVKPVEVLDYASMNDGIQGFTSGVGSRPCAGAAPRNTKVIGPPNNQVSKLTQDRMPISSH